MDSFGPGVSRVLQSSGTQYIETIWQQGKPPCDSDLNLMQSLALEATQTSVLRSVPSGFLGNETNPQYAFLTDPAWSNYFKFGPQRPGETAPIMWANVNGWLIPVAGTHTGAPPGSPNDVDYSNVIRLDPPPAGSGDTRVDFVFLEVWKARIQPGLTTNKPSASGIYQYGNVETGFSYLPDDLIDPAIGFETNQRVQVQYRIRVVKGLVGLTANPDGFDRDVVKAQGAASSPIAGYVFTNMRQELGDPGLWRAGDGEQNALATVDGYTYAIPLAVVFRRNGAVWNGAPSQNLNGGFNRNQTATDRTGVKTFGTVPTLAAGMTASSTALPLVSVTSIPLPPATSTTPVLIRVGDELMEYTSITGNSLVVLRARNNTVAEPHSAGTFVYVVSGRPDGLFADQIANTDILDLRHLVNPNGFDYGTLLKSNLDKLLRGQLRANWKQSGGAGPRGSYVHYQDVLGSATTVSLGVTKLDTPDNIRMVFSDAATIQPVELVCRPLTTLPSGSYVKAINETTWSLGLTVNTTLQNAAAKFSAGDKIVIPVDQLKLGLQAGGEDQVRWVNDGVTGAIRLRFEGENADLPDSMFQVTPAVPGADEDLTITLTTDFPQTATSRLLHIRAHVVYGPGRGLSRRPDALHSVSYLAPSTDLLTQQWGLPGNNKGAHVSWAPLWSKYRSDASNGLLPVTSEMYADLGSKTIIVSPFRRINFPDLVTMDGRAANNASATVKPGTATTGTLAAANGTVINVSSISNVNPVSEVLALVIASGPGRGRYTIVSAAANQITVDRPICAKNSTPLTFAIYVAQGCMPLKTTTGANKWTQTDPLGLFCGTNADQAFDSIYVSLPRHLVPGWGGLATPILSTATTEFATGINYMVRTIVGATPAGAESVSSNYAAYHSGGSSKQFSVFSQVTPTAIPASLPYNTATTGTFTWAGMRFFTDIRGMGRQGLEFPPFYGIARIFGVYQASDYYARFSPFGDARDLNGVGTAVNLLRQSMGPQDGPALWVESDSDGDSTFILNANAIDISRASTPIANFASGTYVVEAVVFGFDRGSFDLNSEVRLVLTRPGNPNGWSTLVGGTAVSVTTRDANINKSVAGLAGLLPGPAKQSDTILVNYSRTVYQGDAWGSQTSNLDLGYAAGPLFSEPAIQIRDMPLDQFELTRPNQKVLEVLAATSFSTDLGTGRYSAEATTSPLDFKNVAYEDPTVPYPPISSVDKRPKSLPGNFVFGDVTSIGSEYLGCTERLPLGALFRDKDFRGQAFTNVPAALVYSDAVGIGQVTGLSKGGPLEQQEIPLGTATSGMGSPGDVLVHVDGEQANYSRLTNFRVTRGGSLFTASGPRPGGALSLQSPLPSVPQSNHVNVLHGRAMLVRNTVTNVGASEVSAGDELMLLIVTGAQRAASTFSPAAITIGTSGAGEGYSAADLYRIEGHPLVRNNIHMQIDPSSIALSRG